MSVLHAGYVTSLWGAGFSADRDVCIFNLTRDSRASLLTSWFYFANSAVAH